MSIEKQIEDFAGVIGQAIDHHSFLGDERMETIDMVGIAKTLYTAGYRKQSVCEWKLRPKSVAQCSVCGMTRNIETQIGWNFCPNCGAKMKGGAE